MELPGWNLPGMVWNDKVSEDEQHSPIKTTKLASPPELEN